VRTFDFDPHAWAQGVLLDLLEQPVTPHAAHLDPSYGVRPTSADLTLLDSLPHGDLPEGPEPLRSA
jgi:hypothetical protein